MTIFNKWFSMLFAKRINFFIFYYIMIFIVYNFTWRTNVFITSDTYIKFIIWCISFICFKYLLRFNFTIIILILLFNLFIIFLISGNLFLIEIMFVNNNFKEIILWTELCSSPHKRQRFNLQSWQNSTNSSPCFLHRELISSYFLILWFLLCIFLYERQIFSLQVIYI